MTAIARANQARQSARAVATAILAITACIGCRRERATANDCARILDKIVELELREQGFRDAELTRRKRDELRRSLAPELRECEGKRLKAGALACVESASTTEQISHHCLR